MGVQISLDPPIRQGGTRYPHLVLQFDKAAKITLKVALKEMEGKVPKESKLEEEMSGKVYKVFRRVLRELTQKKITVPGSYQRYIFLILCLSFLLISISIFNSFLFSFLFSFFFTTVTRRRLR
jgi:hypothetical protein